MVKIINRRPEGVVIAPFLPS